MVDLNDVPDFAYRARGACPPDVRRSYWKAAFGLQAVDGLEPSRYARTLAERNSSGEIDLDEAGALLKEHYRSPAGRDEAPGSLEADLVSRRIVELLEAGSFYLDPSMLSHIHRTLFQDLDPTSYLPGAYKDEELVKCEPVLNGDSVKYCPPAMYAGGLRTLFAREAVFAYRAEPVMATDELENFATFIARVWQIHPFREGNTRTVAVFAELYLRDLGHSVDNAPFEAHAAYFRDALVRANYRNAAVGVDFDLSFITGFFGSVVNGAPCSFDRNELRCQPLFEHPEALRNVSESDAREVRDYLANKAR